MLYLVQLVGSGAANDPWEPPSWDGQGWLDLRGDPTIGGMGLVDMPISINGPRVTKIADDLDELMAVTARTQFESRWSITPTPGRMRDVLGELLTQHGRTDGTRWKPLRRTKAVLRQQVFLRGRPIWEGPRLPPEPSTQTLTETWPTDGTTISTGQDQPWTSVAGNPQVSGGVFQGQTLDLAALIRCDTPLDTDDHYHEATYNLGFASNNETFVILRVRYSDSADTTYFARLAGDANTVGNRGHRLRKIVAGAGTNLYTDSNTPTSGTGQILCSADGSSIRYLCDGVDQTITDTAITGELRCGAEVKRTSGNAANLDNHTMADIVAAVAARPHDVIRGMSQAVHRAAHW